MSRTQRLLLIAPALLLLAACTAAPAPGTGVSEPLPDPVTYAGTGSQDITLQVPGGAQSLLFRFACTSGSFFLVSTGGDLGQDRSGVCGGMNTILMPLPESATATVHALIDVAPDADVTAELSFVEASVSVDPAITADCEALSVSVSATANADDGFARGALDQAGWQAKVDEGKAALDAMDPTPLIAPQVAVLSAFLGDVSEPGAVMFDPPREVSSARDLAGQVCAANNSSIAIMADYGG